MAKTRKILLIIILLLIIIVPLVIYLVPKVEHFLSLIRQSGQTLSLNSAVEQIDDKYIEEYNPKSQRKFDVLHYNISIELFPEDESINGNVTLKILLNDREADKIELNFYDNLKIDKLLLDGKRVQFDRTETNLIISLSETVEDTFFVNVVYKGQPKNLGFGSFNFDKVNNGYMIYTLNEPVFASTWYPCVDLPDDKAYADIYITNDSNYTSLSNGKLIGVKKVGLKKQFHWKTFYPISTYLITVYSALYKTVSDSFITGKNDTINLLYYATEEKIEDARRDFSNHKNYIKTLGELFGEYPFAKEKYGIAEFGWKIGAMENQTITGIGTRFITGKKFFQDMIIHEFAHSWWGNAVGPKTWKDIWLNEGFATYSEALYWEKEAGFDALQTTLMGKDGRFSKGRLYNPANQLFSRLVYNKGAWVLHMLRKEVGDENFFNILRNYYQTYKYKNASTEDLKNICEKISKRNLKHFFDQWIYKGEGYIEAGYNWTVKGTDGNYVTEISIKQLQNGYDIYKFPIDIKLIYENNDKNELRTFYVNNKHEKLTITTKEKPVEIVLDPDNWLIADFDFNADEK
ncbi:MAG: M1 family metallopeptidase [Bacteroidota bacterium]